jgi:hypothetical protein
MLILARGGIGIPSSVFAPTAVRLASSGRLVVPAYRKRKARSGMPSSTTATTAAMVQSDQSAAGSTLRSSFVRRERTAGATDFNVVEPDYEPREGRPFA